MSVTCGAKTKRSGDPCPRPPMANGRCYHHGGASTAGNFKTGLHSVRYRSKLAERAAEFMADPEPGNLAHELAMARALFQEFSSRFDTFTARGEDIGSMMAILSEITRIVERMAKIEDRHAITMAEVKYLTARMADILVKYVPADRRTLALDELEGVLRTPGGTQNASAVALA
jgi:hypothetical protein